jgi:uncharacterized protein DUF6789
MKQVRLDRAILAGVVATLVMTLMIYAAPHLGGPRMDIAAMLGSRLHGGQMPAPLSGYWWMGMMMHWVNGAILFPLFYAYVLYPLLPGRPWVRGLTLGLILWFIEEAMVLPMMGNGFFSAKAPNPMMAVMAGLMAHLIYGAILGALAGPQAQREMQPDESIIPLTRGRESGE